MASASMDLSNPQSVAANWRNCARLIFKSVSMEGKPHDMDPAVSVSLFSFFRRRALQALFLLLSLVFCGGCLPKVHANLWQFCLV